MYKIVFAGVTTKLAWVNLNWGTQYHNEESYMPAEKEKYPRIYKPLSTPE